MCMSFTQYSLLHTSSSVKLVPHIDLGLRAREALHGALIYRDQTLCCVDIHSVVIYIPYRVLCLLPLNGSG